MARVAKRGSSTLICGECNHKASVFRKGNQLRESGHVKHMYCPNCLEEKPFLEHTVADKVEMLWALDAIGTSGELSRLLRIYSKTTSTVLDQEKQTALLATIYQELGMNKDNLNAEKVRDSLLSKGYNVHILKSFKQN